MALSRTQKVVLAVAGVALVAAIGGGVAVSTMNQSRQTTRTGVPANPKQATAVSTETATTTPEVNTDIYGKAMEQYVTMSVEEFESLPRDERLQYSEYLIAQTVSRGNYDVTYGSSSTNHSLSIAPVKASLTNSGQEIIDIYVRGIQMSMLQFKETEAQPFDLKDGNKVLSSVFYEVAKDKTLCNNYPSMKSYQATLSKSQGMLTEGTATNTSGLLSGIDQEGNRVQYKIVTWFDNHNATGVACFVYTTYKSYDGSEESTWLLDNQATTLGELEAVKTIK